MPHLHRTAIWLEQTQLDSLRELAAAEGRSMSDAVREAVTRYLDKRKGKTRQQNALEMLAESPEDHEAISRNQ